jgi:hypothetical protein
MIQINDIYFIKHGPQPIKLSFENNFIGGPEAKEVDGNITVESGIAHVHAEEIMRWLGEGGEDMCVITPMISY